MWKLLLLLLLIIPCTIYGQRNSGSSFVTPGCKAPDHRHDTDRRGGDSASAIRSRQHRHADNVLKAQLGYIDTSIASLQEVLDNSWVGLLVVPESKYKVIDFRLDVGLLGMDTRAVYIKGPKLVAMQYYYPLSCNVDEANRLLRECKPGCTLYFSNIRLKKNDSDNIIHVKDFEIRIAR